MTLRKKPAEIAELARKEEWAEAPTRKKTPRKLVTFYIEEDIYYRLKNYVDTKAKRYESMSYIVNRALEKFLNEVETGPDNPK